MTLRETIFRDWDWLLESLMAVVRFTERFLGPDDDWVEEDRRIAYEFAQSHLSDLTGHTFTREKGRDDYVCTANAKPNAIENLLDKAGYQRNLASTRKYRTDHDGGKQWSAGSWVLDPKDTSWQFHVYLFEGPNGGTDIYSHHETSVREGKEHILDTDQEHGDPYYRLRGLLEQSKFTCSKRDF